MKKKKWYDIQRLFDNPKPTVYGIVVFVLLMLLLFSVHSRGADLYFDAGSTVVRGYTPTIGVNLVFPQQGPVNTSYEVGFNLIGQSTFRDKD